MPSPNKTSVTAVLAVYNGADSLTSCLDSLLTQSFPRQIIVVDDGSTDGTLTILRRYPKIKVFKQSHGGPAQARNLGSSHAQGQILLFVDADMTFDRNYVATLIAPILKGKVVGTYTTEERVSNWHNIWARCWNYQEGWEDRKRFPSNPPQYGTDFRAILKSEFDRVGGFDDIGYTDTWSLFHKLGVKPLATRAVCYHANPATLSAVYHQARWSAKRPYKLGLVGTFYALLRTSLPISLVTGTVKSFKYQNPAFFLFKIVYDFGRFVGIGEMFLTHKHAK